MIFLQGSPKDGPQSYVLMEVGHMTQLYMVNTLLRASFSMIVFFFTKVTWESVFHFHGN